MQEKERIDSYWLCNMKGIGAASIRKLLEKAGSVETVLSLPEKTVRALLGDRKAECFLDGLGQAKREAAKRSFYRLEERGIFFLPFWDEDYPERLLRIYDAPVCLYGKGKLPGAGKKAVAVIGTRECSPYGRDAAGYFAGGLAQQDVVIISGMARGVDGIAQWAALEAGGSTVGVLGCGVDICYPPENRELYERLVREGCLLSEYPPGTNPKASLFPPRNRIISGLSDMVLVIEAREKSGTLITVDMALEQGRDVFALPGRITDGCSRGCNRLIANGAGMAKSVPQILRELKMEGTSVPAGSRCEKAACDTPVGEGLDGRIRAALDEEPVCIDELQKRLAAQGERPPVAELMHALMLLSMEGAVKSRAGMFFTEKKQEFFHLH